MALQPTPRASRTLDGGPGEAAELRGTAVMLDMTEAKGSHSGYMRGVPEDL